VFEIFSTTDFVKQYNTLNMSEAVEPRAPAADTVSAVKGMKKNGTSPHMTQSRFHRLICSFPGKQWHDNKTAFRPRANQTSWDKRTLERKALAAVKAKEKELKEEKETERQVRFCAT
jgi:rRNA-processing protein CGR1